MQSPRKCRIVPVEDNRRLFAPGHQWTLCLIWTTSGLSLWHHCVLPARPTIQSSAWTLMHKQLIVCQSEEPWNHKTATVTNTTSTSSSTLFLLPKIVKPVAQTVFDWNQLKLTYLFISLSSCTQDLFKQKKKTDLKMSDYLKRPAPPQWPSSNKEAHFAVSILL